MLEELDFSEVGACNECLEADVPLETAAHIARDHEVDWSIEVTLISSLVGVVDELSFLQSDLGEAIQQLDDRRLTQAFEKTVSQKPTSVHPAEHLVTC